MKYLRLTVIALLAILIVSCNITDPHELERELPEPEPEKVSVFIKAVSEVTGDRITDAEILFNGEVKASDGLYEDEHEEADVDISVTVRANDFETEELIINTSDDVHEIVALSPAEDNDPDDDDGDNLSDWKTHEVNFGFDETIWVSGYEDRLSDELLTYGEVRPILTDAEPVDKVKIEVHFKLDEEQIDTEHFLLEISFESDGSNAFRTPLYVDQPDVDGWTSGTTTVDADLFEVKEKASVRVIHGDAVTSDAPTGPDDVFFTKDDEGGKLLFYWRTKVQSKQKARNTPDRWITNANTGVTKSVSN